MADSTLNKAALPTSLYQQCKILRGGIKLAIEDAFRQDGLHKYRRLARSDVIVRNGKASWDFSDHGSPRPAPGMPCLRKCVNPLFDKIDLNEVAASYGFDCQLSWDHVNVQLLFDRDDHNDEVTVDVWVWVDDDIKFMQKLHTCPRPVVVPVAEQAVDADLDSTVVSPRSVCSTVAPPSMPSSARKRRRDDSDSSSSDEENE